MSRRFLFAAALFVTFPALAGAARITFQRTLRAPHDLGVDNVAVIFAIGDNQKVSMFVDEFVGYAGRAGTLRIENDVDNNQRLAGFGEAELKKLRKRGGADAYIGISLFTCAGAEHTGEVGDTNVNGQRIRTKVQWIDAVCSAKIDARRTDGKQIVTFMTHGDGTSPRVAQLTDDDRDIAYSQAARFAAFSAAESIAPRTQRESIELDEHAPSFDDGIAMINSERFADARAIWEIALTRNQKSAALHYNLGAVCEAIGDLRAAEEYYRTAAEMAPKEALYRSGFNQFRKRYEVKAPR